jgi:acetate kinase
MRVLALNGGSSSFKAALFQGSDLRLVWERHGDLELDRALAGLREERIDAVGHRIVHGGRAYRDTTRITPEVKQAIVRMASFAPEHNRLEVEAIDQMELLLGPEVPQVAVFDTAFHATMPEAAYVYPGPYGWVEQGIRRFGFHGISHQYVSRRAAELMGRQLSSLRMVTCHLGGGSSLAAVRDGRSVDTTMGFTPLEGLMMGTRSGSVDPGVLIHLARHCGYGAAELDRILNKESGLAGVSGISSDMREVVAAIRAGNARARLAFDIFVHRLCGGVGAMAASLEGVDALVFTAGIGENSTEVRSAVCARLAWLGLKIDEERNRADGDRDIAVVESRVRVLVVKTQEEREIAREVMLKLQINGD